MITMVQNPSLPFDPAAVTAPPYTAMDFPLAPVILLAWTIPLAAVAVLAAVSAFAYDQSQRDRASGLLTLFAWLTGVLLIGPAVLSSLIGPTGPDHNEDAVPNVFGYVTATKKDSNGEFTDWAHRRYGVDLTAAQADTLMQRKPVYAGRTDNVSNVVLLVAHEVHSYFDDAGTIRLMAGTEEMGGKR